MKRSTRIGAISTVLLIGAVALIVANAYTPRTVTPATPSHPTVTASQPCTSCKTPTHQYRHKTPYQGPCARCHNLVSWRRVSYVHRNTAFNVGMHPVLGCSWCHVEGAPLIKADCNRCHTSKHGGPKACAKCHTAVAWSLRAPLPAGHVSLLGGHAGLRCFDCHAKPAFAATPRTCTTCHGTKHGGLTNCALCHSPERGWKPLPGFDHSVFFPLTGRHSKVECGKCHVNNRFAGTPTFCSGCHGVQHGGLTDCGRCHTTSGFVPSTFRHSSVFVLSGAHARLACSACHPGNAFARLRFAGSGTACVRCHGVQHGGLTNCRSCHNTTAFIPSTFRHASVFVLSGAHASLACEACHPGNAFARLRFAGSGTACVRCHGPQHGGLTNCTRCHTTSGFVLIRTFKHTPSVPLGPIHLGLAHPCAICHHSLNFVSATTPCVTCHLHSSPHVAPTDCLRCHRPTVWTDIHFTHIEMSYHYAALGVRCVDCHTTGNFAVYSCDHCHDPGSVSPYPPYSAQGLAAALKANGVRRAVARIKNSSD